MKFKVAINCCGLHVGGAVQVATSFIDEVTYLNASDLDIHIFASSEIDKNLEKISSKARNHENYKVLDVFGISTIFSQLNKELSDFAVVFTIFGPNYLLFQKNIQVVGFAQPWIIDNSAYVTLNTRKKILFKIKFFFQKLFFKSADKLVVELDHVKSRLIELGISDSKNIEVVHNCISSTFLKPESWAPLNINSKSDKFSIGYLGRDYIHKNTNLLPKVKMILNEKYNIDANFFVTMTDLEWSSKEEIFKNEIINVGALSIAQCPSFYQAMDAVIFPSLLECFSATPLEAMAMKKPLFASDKDFVRDVCADFAWYFDPLDAESAADIIAKYINNYHGKDNERLSSARDRVLNFSNARGRAIKYLDIIRQSLPNS